MAVRHDESARRAPQPARLPAATLIAAIVVLAAFTAFVIFLITAVDSSEVRWSRLAWVFASVEAIAFGAAGALFGSSIQRSRAESAEADARHHATEAAKGRALAETLVAEGSESGTQVGELEPFDSTERVGEGESLAQRHARLARSLFPDVSA
jgi:hypothetical protein